MTKSESAFVARCMTGDGWYVPAQSTMVQRLERRGLVRRTDETRSNAQRGITERLAVSVRDCIGDPCVAGKVGMAQCPCRRCRLAVHHAVREVTTTDERSYVCCCGWRASVSRRQNILAQRSMLDAVKAAHLREAT